MIDRTVKTGDMELGCDGVHSLLRTTMWGPCQLNRTAAGLFSCFHPPRTPELKN